MPAPRILLFVTAQPPSPRRRAGHRVTGSVLHRQFGQDVVEVGLHRGLADEHLSAVTLTCDYFHRHQSGAVHSADGLSIVQDAMPDRAELTSAPWPSCEAFPVNSTKDW